MHFRLATWNINSVRLRLDLVQRFVRAENPDVLCLQEIKCQEDQFPRAAFEAMGFPHIAVTGRGKAGAGPFAPPGARMQAA